MGMDRRKFIKIAGFSTLVGLGGKSAFELLFPGELEAAFQAKTETLKGKRWAMVVDMKKMDEATARKCVEACHKVHNVPNLDNPINPKDKVSSEEKVRWEIKWIWTEHYHNAFPGTEYEHMVEKVAHLPFPLLCNHCDNPPCVRVCPTQATYRRPDGIVMMDMHRCIGCRFCMAGCPFSARSFNWRDPRPFVKEVFQEYPTREPGVVEKCTFCEERLAKGQLPACVVASNGALIFGDLTDAKSKVREALKEKFTIRRKPFLGTNPQVYYIV